MTLLAALRRDFVAWVRQPWVLLAGVLALLQFAVIWGLSAQGPWGGGVTPRARHALAPSADPGGGLGPWLWLLHPGVMLATTPEDFSAAAWMQGPGLVVEFESVKRTDQPLPFETLARISATPELRARDAASHAWNWELPAWSIPAPEVAAVPFPRSSVASILGAADGPAFRTPPMLPLAPAGTAPDALVLRLVLDQAGTVAAPPVVWESSGDVALDAEVAARALGWLFTGVPRADGPGGVFPVLVRIEWGVEAPGSP